MIWSRSTFGPVPAAAASSQSEEEHNKILKEQQDWAGNQEPNGPDPEAVYTNWLPSGELAYPSSYLPLSVVCLTVPTTATTLEPQNDQGNDEKNALMNCCGEREDSTGKW